MENFTPSELLNLYERLYLARACEERIRTEYPLDEIKTPVHLGIGGEAISVGVHAALGRTTKYFATYRNHSIFLTLSQSSDAFFGELYGKITGPGKGKAGSMHLACPNKGLLATSAVVGTTIPLAVGAALANRYRDLNDLVVVFFGDGAVEEGVFWESLNFACLHRLPILFVCEDNDLAIHTDTRLRRGFKSLECIVRSFHCHFELGNGSDLFSVIEHTRYLLKAYEKDPKPMCLQLPYYRFLEHVGPSEDFGAGYRTKPDRLAEKWDPVYKIEQKLIDRGLIPEMERVQIEVTLKIDESVKRAKEAPFPEATELWSDVFAEGSYEPVKQIRDDMRFMPGPVLSERNSSSIEAEHA